jgi:hypothetical protein
VSRDFKKMAVAADLWNNIPEDTDDVIQEAIDLIKYQSEGQTGPDGEPVYPELVGKLEAIQLVFISAQVAIDAVRIAFPFARQYALARIAPGDGHHV